jgi:hypothetical protein
MAEVCKESIEELLDQLTIVYRNISRETQENERVLKNKVERNKQR